MSRTNSIGYQLGQPADSEGRLEPVLVVVLQDWLAEAFLLRLTGAAERFENAGAAAIRPCHRVAVDLGYFHPLLERRMRIAALGGC